MDVMKMEITKFLTTGKHLGLILSLGKNVRLGWKYLLMKMQKYSKEKEAERVDKYGLSLFEQILKDYGENLNKEIQESFINSLLTGEDNNDYVR